MNIRKQILILPVLFFLLLPTTASAATISLRATPAIVGVGDMVQVTVLLDSAVPTNAFSGNLHYSSATLEPVAVNDGNSIVSVWITRPMVTSAGAPITFAGITPGGFSGDNGVLFSILFKAKRAGTATISLQNIEVLRNDGEGGKEPTTIRSLALSIGVESLGGYTEPTDQTPPESFTALLGIDPQLFGGKAYLVFAAVDKSSGIDHYAVAESRLPSFLFRFFPLVWNTTTGPYMVADQGLTSTMYLKAVDRAGNERLSIYPPQHLLTLYEKAALLAILILVVLLWQSGWGRRRRLHP